MTYRWRRAAFLFFDEWDMGQMTVSVQVIPALWTHGDDGGRASEGVNAGQFTTGTDGGYASEGV